MIFEDGAVRYRHLQRADPLHRGLEPRECRCILGGNGGDLGREAGGRPRLVGDDEATGFLHRVADRFRIERHQAARIDDLDRDPLGGKLFGRSERLVNEPGERDDGYVAAFAFDVGLAERDRVVLLRHRSLARHQPARFERDDGVVVADRRL